MERELEVVDWKFYGVEAIESSPCMYDCDRTLVRHVGSLGTPTIQMSFEDSKVYARNYGVDAVDTQSHTICYDSH